MTTGFVIAATGSGSGKTTLSLAVMAWLSKNGYRVAPFKVGPDFIDPGHHAAAAGRNSYNLDSWMLSESYNQWLFATHTRDADVAVVEGVMGLFDGFDAETETGSTAQMAKWLGLDAVLVVDAGGMARSAAAMVKGFESFDPELRLAGVIFSKVGSKSHYDFLRTAVAKHCRTRCLGYLLKNDAVKMEERHLGLVTAQEKPPAGPVLDELARMVEQTVEMRRLMEILRPLRGDLPVRPPVSLHPVNAAGCKIAVARDPAFCFYYEDNLAFLEQAGAEIVAFSPLKDDRLPDGIGGIYLGGGYPEVFAAELARQSGLLSRIKKCSDDGMPIYAECGGFMVLCDSIAEDAGVQEYTMAGCFPFRVSIGKTLQSLGYREIILTRDTVIGRRGQVLRGHEFHYSSIEYTGKDPAAATGRPPVEFRHPGLIQDLFSVTTRTGGDVSLKGFQVQQTLGSYFHVHFGSNPAAARCFVENCHAFTRRVNGDRMQSL